MKAIFRNLLVAAFLLYSCLGFAQPTVDLIWTSTTGSGTTGSSEIRAQPGDYVRLSIYVNGNSTGFFLALLDLAWNAPNLTAYDPVENCLSACVNSTGSHLFMPWSPGVDTSPGSAATFDAVGIETSTGETADGSINDTLLLGWIDFSVESGASTEVVSLDYSADAAVGYGFPAATFIEPVASATILPPCNGCGCPL